MRNFFNADSWFWQRMNDLADIILLWLLCCLPIVTMGPGTAAIYYVMIKKVRGDDGEGIWRLFVRSFRRNFKQGLIVGLLMTALIVLLYVDIQFYAQAQGMLRPLFGSLTVVGGAVVLLLLPYLVGQMAQFENTIRRYFINSLFFMIRHFWSTLKMAAVSALGIAAVWLMPPLILLVPGFAVYLHGGILVKLFDRYIPQESDDEDIDTADADTDINET